MAFTALEAHVLEFSSNVELLSQQQTSKLESCVTLGTFYGEGAEAIKQYGETEFADLSDPTADTAFDTISKTSRWIYPADKKNALPSTREDWLRMISDPVSPLVAGQAAALGRLKDAYILRGLTGTSQVGKYDAQVATALPAGQILTPATFSLGAVKDAIALLQNADTYMPGDETVVVLSADHARILQDDPEFTSSDYFTSQAFSGGVSGNDMYEQKLQGFLSCRWVVLSSKFLGSDLTTTIAGEDLSNTAFVYRKSGVTLGVWNKDGQMVYSRVDERADKNYTLQVYSKLTLGSTRTEEVKVVKIAVTPV